METRGSQLLFSQESHRVRAIKLSGLFQPDGYCPCIEGTKQERRSWLFLQSTLCNEPGCVNETVLGTYVSATKPKNHKGKSYTG